MNCWRVSDASSFEYMKPRLLSTSLTLCLSSGLLFANPAWADQQEIQTYYRHSTLTQGLDDWNDWRLYWQRSDAAKNRLYIDYTNRNRFAVSDNNVAVGRHYYRSDALQYQAELTLSNANTLFPAYSLFTGINTKLNLQTLLTAGFRHSHFRKVDPVTKAVREPDSEGLNARLEYYFGDSLIAYSLFYTLMQGPAPADNVTSQSLKYLYVYRQRSTVFVSYASGGDIDYDPSTTQLTISQIDSLILGGSHWLSETSALVYTVANHQVTGSGFGYQRNEIYIGLRKLTR
jgi:YaiO family outer membrane protein